MMLKLIIILAVVIRLSLILLPSFKIDMTDWQAWTARLVELGPFNFYSPQYFADYFPGYLYFLWILGEFYKFLNPNVNFFSDNFAYLLKFSTNLFDFGSAFLVFKTILNYQKKSWAILGSILYLVNPALIFNSSVWGQVDGILTFFLLLAFYLYLEVKKTDLGSISSSLALLIKPQALAVFPILLIHLIRNVKLTKFTLSISILIFLPIIISIPFFLKNPMFGLWDLFQKTAQGYQYTSLYAFNFWSLVGWWQSDLTHWLFGSYQFWGLILYLVAMLFIAIPLLQKKIENKQLYFATALALFSFFLFPTRVHERYLFPFFAFSIIVICLYKNKLLLFLYASLSIINFLNLWYVYFYYNFVYDNATYSKNVLFHFIDKSYQIFAILSLLIFAGFITIYFKRNERIT